jgi:hypothetical protein
MHFLLVFAAKIQQTILIVGVQVLLLTLIFALA